MRVYMPVDEYIYTYRPVYSCGHVSVQLVSGKVHMQRELQAELGPPLAKKGYVKLRIIGHPAP